MLLTSAIHSEAWMDDVYAYGDIRTRFYYSDPLLYPAQNTSNDHSDYSGDSRLRITGSIQPSDSITAQASLQWDTTVLPDRITQGSDNVSAGAYSWEWDQWGLGPSCLKWQDIFFSPLSLSVERDCVQYDNGLLFSAMESEWLLDHIKLGYSTPSVNASAFYASVSSLAPDTPFLDFAFMHGQRINHSDVFSSISAYSGVFSMKDNGTPIIAGLYADILNTREWNIFLETAGETGTRPDDQSLLAVITDTGISYRWQRKNNNAPDTIRTRWTFASGDPTPNGQHAFIPLFNYEQWGCVFSPELSNIHILSLSGNTSLAKNLHIELAGFSYFQAHLNQSEASIGNFNNGGYTRDTNGKERELGYEIDGSILLALPGESQLKIQGGYFIRGSAYANATDAGNASEILIQFNMLF